MTGDLPAWLGAAGQEWLLAGLVLVTTAIGLRFVIGVLRRRLKQLAARTTTTIDDVLVIMLDGTRAWFSVAIGALLASQVLELPEQTQAILAKGAIILILLQVALWGHAGIGAGVARLTRPEEGAPVGVASSASAVTFVIRVAFWSLIVLMMLGNLGVDITAVVAGLGVGGIAVALAVQNILGDLFASLAIALDKPVVIGDFIVMGDFAGSVEHIGLKTTQLRSISGEQIILANSDLLNSRIRNYKRMNERRIVLGIGVTYETPRELLRTIPGVLKDIVTAREDVRFDRAHLKGFGASSIDYEIVYYVLSPDYNAYMDAQQAIALAIIDAFHERGVEFAYPTQTIHLAGGQAGAA